MAPGDSNLRLSAVQALRGIAASLVVFFHFAHMFQGSTEFSRRWMSELGDLGACGVDIFFVISGFIMVYTMRKKAGKQDAIAFVGKRILRIYPLYWIWTMVLVALWVAGVGQRVQHWSMSYFVTSLLLLPFFNGLDCHPMLSQGWTLAFEMYFYLLFAVGVVLKLRHGRLPFLTVTFITLGLLSRFLAAGSGARYVLDNPILIEFLYGVLAGELITSMPTLSKHRWARRASFSFISLGVIALASTMMLHNVSPLRSMLYGLPALSIVFGAALLGPLSAPRLLVYLGDCSYSIYITHVFFLMLFRFILNHFSLFRVTPTAMSIVLSATVTIALSSTTHFLIERPVTRILSSASAMLLGRRRHVSLFRVKQESVFIPR